MPAKKPTNSQPSERPRLTVSRDEATRLIAEQIQVGTELSTLQTVPEDLEEKSSHWSSFTVELLRKLFTTEELARDFRGWYFGSSDPNPHKYLENLRRDIGWKLSSLKSIHQKLPLYDEPARLPRTVRNIRDVAQICVNGHLIVGSIRRHPAGMRPRCKDCGSKTVTECGSCSNPIEGIGEDDWMGEQGPFRPPAYCDDCGKPFPWTESALSAAREYSEDLDALSQEEKATLTTSVAELTSDTPRTPLAANRVRKFMEKIGAPAAQGFMQIVVSVLTEEAKRQLGLK